MTIVKKPHIPRIAPCHGLGLVVFFVTYGLFILISPSLFRRSISFFILYYVQKIYGRSEYFGVFTQYTHCEYTIYSVLFFNYIYILFLSANTFCFIAVRSRPDVFLFHRTQFPIKSKKSPAVINCRTFLLSFSVVVKEYCKRLSYDLQHRSMCLSLSLLH